MSQVPAFFLPIQTGYGASLWIPSGIHRPTMLTENDPDDVFASVFYSIGILMEKSDEWKAILDRVTQ